MGRARKQRRAAKQGGGEGEGGEAPEPKLSRRKRRKLAQEELDNRPPALKDYNWQLRRKFERMSIGQLEKLLEKYGDKPKFATKVRMIKAALKSKRAKLANAPTTAAGEQPKALPKRRKGLAGLVVSEYNLLRLKRKYGKGQ